MTEISIQFTRFSAFYSPLIATIAGGFLKEEGFAPALHRAGGKSAIEGLWPAGARRPVGALPGLRAPGEGPDRRPPCTSPQINEMDGFFLTGRAPDPGFTWDKLRASGCSWTTAASRSPCSSTPATSAGSTSRPSTRWISPAGRWTRPFARARATTSTSRVPLRSSSSTTTPATSWPRSARPSGPCAFSSLAATREWLGTDMARRFMRAYRKARAWILDTPAAEIAEGGGLVLSRDRPGGARFDDRVLPEARLLDAARRDHAAGLRGRAGRVRALRPDHPAPPLRGRGRPAAAG